MISSNLNCILENNCKILKPTNPAPNNINDLWHHQKMTRYEDISSNHQKSQSIETDPEMTQILEIDKDIKMYPMCSRK